MSCILDVIVGTLVKPIVDIVSKKVVSHVGYVVRYKKNMKELEDEKKKLETKIDENKEKVEQANIRNDVVEKKVEEWAMKADEMKREAEDLVVAMPSNENTKCVKFSCPNICWRYRTSKQAEQKKIALEGHIRDGNFSTVAHFRSLPSERQFQSTTDKFMDFHSRKPLCKKIMDRLLTPEVTRVGVYGAGGVGKTTAVEEVCKQLKKEGVFYEVIEGVVSQDVNVQAIQLNLGRQLKMEFKSNTEEGRADELWTRLNNEKNNLVILDDLWKELNLRAIGIPLKGGNKGCKVILTTRDRKVLKKMEVDDSVEVKVLSEIESWDLFKNKVGINFASDELRSVAKLVCKECGGLPVAILAVGGALAGEEHKDCWYDALNKLQNSLWEKVAGIDEKMYASLRLSYDCLAKENKEALSILLLCCLYPEDAQIPVRFLLFHCIARELLEPIDDTVEKARRRVSTLLDLLKARSLLLDRINRNFVKMHDVIRDVVISIAKSEEHYLVKDALVEWPAKSINENLAAVSIRFNKLEEVTNELVCPHLHTLRIECMNFSFEFPDNFFGGFGELRILELKGIHMSSIPSSLANLSELRTLILVDCKLQDMSLLKGLKSNLEVLVIENCSIEALPTELGELSNLRVLILNKCDKLTVIPAGVISKLTRLEELRFPDVFSFGINKIVEVVRRAIVSELSSLIRLTSLSISIPKDTPVPKLCFGNLVNYQLAVGTELYESPYSQRGSRIILYDTTYNDVFATLLERAEEVELWRVEGLKDSLSSIASFSKLTQLQVVGCNFKFLFTSSCAKALQQLRCLKITNCEMLEEVIGSEGEKDELDQSNHMLQFSKLTKLTLLFLPKLKSFGPKVENGTTAEGVSLPKGQPLFGEKAMFPSLECLMISHCSSITGIWDEQVLANVQVENCDKLVNVFPSNMLTMGQNLKEIIVENCNGLEYVFTIIGVEESETESKQIIIFPYLCKVKLVSLINLKSFCGNSSRSDPQHLFDSMTMFPSLECLMISHCSRITGIWDELVLSKNYFPQLANVQVENCDKLVNVFPSNMLTMGKNLKEIIVENCNGLEYVFTIIGVEESETESKQIIIFPYLCKVKLVSLINLKSFCGNSSRSDPQHLFDSMAMFPSLECLMISHCSSITGIWDEQVLANVQVENCDKLVNVFPSNMLTMGKNLKEIIVENCNGLEYVFTIIGVEESETESKQIIIFPYLCKVKLVSLINLKSFCGNSSRSDPQHLFDSMAMFPSLECLMISDCSSITGIWDEQVLAKNYFPQLANVQVENCDKLVNVFPSNMLTMGQNLKEIIVENCNGLEYVFTIIGVEESETESKQIIIFPYLCKMQLIYLGSLKSFCGNPSKHDLQPLFDPQMELICLGCLKSFCGNPSKHDLQPLFDPQVQFPVLSSLYLIDVPNQDTFKQQLSKEEVQFPALSSFWLIDVPNQDTFKQQLSKGEVMFPALQDLVIDNGPLAVRELVHRRLVQHSKALRLKFLHNQ